MECLIALIVLAPISFQQDTFVDSVLGTKCLHRDPNSTKQDKPKEKKRGNCIQEQRQALLVLDGVTESRDGTDEYKTAETCLLEVVGAAVCVRLAPHLKDGKDKRENANVRKTRDEGLKDNSLGEQHKRNSTSDDNELPEPEPRPVGCHKDRDT